MFDPLPTTGVSGQEPWAPLINSIMTAMLQKTSDALKPSPNPNAGLTEEEIARNQETNRAKDYLANVFAQHVTPAFQTRNSQGQLSEIDPGRRNEAMTAFANKIEPDRLGRNWNALQQFMTEKFGGQNAVNDWYGQRFVPDTAATIGNILTLGMGGFQPQGSDWNRAIERINAIRNASGDETGMTHGFQSGRQMWQNWGKPAAIGAGVGLGAGYGAGRLAMRYAPSLAQPLGLFGGGGSTLAGAVSAGPSTVTPSGIMSALYPTAATTVPPALPFLAGYRP